MTLAYYKIDFDRMFDETLFIASCCESCDTYFNSELCNTEIRVRWNFQKTLAPFFISSPAWIQSHHREVPRRGVSNGTRLNWKCFLAYKFLNLLNLLRKKNNFILCNFLVRTIQSLYSYLFLPMKTWKKKHLKSCS